MLSTLRAHRHSHYRSILILVMMVSWLFMLVASTCAMPMPVQLPAVDAMPVGCSESMHHSEQTKHFSSQAQDCVLKSCPDSQPNPTFNIKIDKPEIPLFIACLVWLIGCLFSYRPPQLIFNRIRPPIGKPIPLFYRFCTLLN